MALWAVLCLLPRAGVAQTSATDVMEQLAETEPVVEEETTVKAQRCGPSPLRVKMICEPGAGFLCINTPPGSTTEKTITIDGLIDRKNHAFAGLKVAVQHDQTKAIQEIETTDAVAQDGVFSITVPLTNLGSYTVVLQALRAGGDPIVRKVTTSRVVAPKMNKAVVTMSPDPAANNGLVVGGSVNLSIDLLPDCERCDYIGSSTSGTLITVQNTITTATGATQRIERQTDLGADGQFALCVPTATGNNDLTIYACNAATGYDITKCPKYAPVTFDARDTRLHIELIQPTVSDPATYDAATTKAIDMAFRVEGLDETVECRNLVSVLWNRDDAVSVCPDHDGVYHLQAKPEVGINVGLIQAEDSNGGAEQPLTIGWGRVRSPWDVGGRPKADAQLWEPDALTMGIRQQFMAETVRSIFNNVMASDQLGDLIQRLVDRPVDQLGQVPETSATDAIMAKIRTEIPHCQGAGGLSNMRMQLVEPPRVGKLEIAQVQYAEDEMQLTLIADPKPGENVALEVKARFFRDDNGDGQADGPALPLKISFRKLVAQPIIRLERTEPPRVMLTANTTNCDYQSADYCVPRPAVLIPANFVGSAAPAGVFVVCDHESQIIDENIVEGCKALNYLNASTNGPLSAQVLEALNEMLYCSGSSALTYFFREGVRDMHLHLGCGAGTDGHGSTMSFDVPLGSCEEGEGLLSDRSYDIPVGLDLVHSTMRLNPRGMMAAVATRLGNSDFYGRLTTAHPVPHVGYLVDPDPPYLPDDLGLSGQRDLAFGAGEHFINQLLFVLGVQGSADAGTGILDWELHEPFFKRIGFDYVKECDEFDARTGGADAWPALCNLRPQVKRMFGSALTVNEYFPGNQPVSIRLRGSRTLLPRVKFFDTDVPSGYADDGVPTGYRHAQFIDVQIPDVEISFYALAFDEAAGIDEHGNTTLLTDENGDPMIHSMRPELDDPYDGFIVRTHATMLMPLEIGPLEPDPDDPSKLRVRLNTNPRLTKFVFDTRPGDNSTIVPSSSLLSNFREILLTGFADFSYDNHPIFLRLDKRVAFTGTASNALTDVTSWLGLQAVRLAKDGLGLGINKGQDYVTMSTSLHFTQRLVVGGELIEWTIPEY